GPARPIVLPPNSNFAGTTLPPSMPCRPSSTWSATSAGLSLTAGDSSRCKPGPAARGSISYDLTWADVWGRRRVRKSPGSVCPVRASRGPRGAGFSGGGEPKQAPPLLPLLEQGALERGWSFGRPFVIRYCRVGLLNELGELLDPAVVVLLIGERPGLATADSLSAYLAFRPRPGHTDARRNLISNIHARRVAPNAAANRVLALAAKMRSLGASGVEVKEDLPALEGQDQIPSLGGNA